MRKHKRAELPQQLEPKVTEEWVEEEKLELWEIRGFREKQDRDKAMSLTRSRTGTAVKEPQQLDPGDVIKNCKSDVDVKSQMEEQLRTQRKALLKKSASLVQMPGTLTPTPPPNPTIFQRIQNPDGTVRLIRSVARPVVSGVTSLTTATMTPITGRLPALKRISVTKDRKILGGSLAQPQIMKSAYPATPVSQSAPVTSAAMSSPGSQQRIQIIRSSNGKLQIYGLLPGQQLVQTPDGKLQIFTPQSVALKSNPARLGTPTQVVSNTGAAAALLAVQPPNKLVLTMPNQVGVTPAAQINQKTIPAKPQQTVVGSPVKLVKTNAVSVPAQAPAPVVSLPK